MSQELSPEVKAVLAKIRQIRVEKGMSILELATEAEITRSYVFYIERMDKVPTLVVLDKIAKALGVQMKEFFV